MTRPRPTLRQSIRHRWFLPPRTAFLAVPLPVLEVLTHHRDLGAAELRVALWLLADWYWPSGLRREVNVLGLARRARMAGPNVHRALAGLVKHGLLGVARRGRGKLPVLDIEPLVQAARSTSEGGSRRYTKKGDVDKVYQGDTPKYQDDTRRCINPEPGVRTQSASYQNHLKRPRGEKRAAEDLRRQEILDTMERLARGEKAPVDAPDVPPSSDVDGAKAP